MRKFTLDGCFDYAAGFRKLNSAVDARSQAVGSSETVEPSDAALEGAIDSL